MCASCFHVKPSLSLSLELRRRLLHCYAYDSTSLSPTLSYDPAAAQSWLGYVPYQLSLQLDAVLKGVMAQSRAAPTDTDQAGAGGALALVPANPDPAGIATTATTSAATRGAGMASSLPYLAAALEAVRAAGGQGMSAPGGSGSDDSEAAARQGLSSDELWDILKEKAGLHATLIRSAGIPLPLRFVSLHCVSTPSTGTFHLLLLFITLAFCSLSSAPQLLLPYLIVSSPSRLKVPSLW